MISTRKQLMDALVDGGFWIPSGVPGVFGRSGRFEAIVRAFDSIIIEIADEAGAERVEFPPVVDREVVRRVNYMESFPELCGSIHSYREHLGRHDELVDRVDEGGDWGGFLEQMPLTLCPAACYPVYPSCVGTLPDGGRHFVLSSYVFRAEPSDDPARLQSFRQRENVRIADAKTVRDWRRVWSVRAREIFEGLALPVQMKAASDPFFGRGGRLLAANQIAEELKSEILIPITSQEDPTAICSLNYHEDKFARAFGIQSSEGTEAHSACIGFGLERVALALLVSHGFSTDAWPSSVRGALSL